LTQGKKNAYLRHGAFALGDETLVLPLGIPLEVGGELGVLGL
jgi:hypothetical protein